MSNQSGNGVSNEQYCSSPGTRKSLTRKPILLTYSNIVPVSVTLGNISGGSRSPRVLTLLNCSHPETARLLTPPNPPVAP
jgi:hypothetical protein